MLVMLLEKALPQKAKPSKSSVNQCKSVSKKFSAFSAVNPFVPSCPHGYLSKTSVGVWLKTVVVFAKFSTKRVLDFPPLRR
jgi:hypothetical protein